MTDGDDALRVARRTAWWIADVAAGISISFSVIAQMCRLFIEHNRLDMAATEDAFVTQVAAGLGYVALGWIVVSAALAVACRIRYGIASETAVYLALLLLAIVAVAVAH